jgi:hypothetical protein
MHLNIPFVLVQHRHISYGAHFPEFHASLLVLLVKMHEKVGPVADMSMLNKDKRKQTKAVELEDIRDQKVSVFPEFHASLLVLLVKMHEIERSEAVQ